MGMKKCQDAIEVIAHENHQKLTSGLLDKKDCAYLAINLLSTAMHILDDFDLLDTDELQLEIEEKYINQSLCGQINV